MPNRRVVLPRPSAEEAHAGAGASGAAKTVRRRPRGHAHRRAQPLPAALLPAGERHVQIPDALLGQADVERRDRGVPSNLEAPSRHRRDSSPSTRPWVVLFSILSAFRRVIATSICHTGNLFSVDLLDASGEIRGTFFKETADKVFPLLEEGKVYTFQETPRASKPANKQYTSLSHEFELTFGNVTVEACDDDAGISQIKGDWQPLSRSSATVEDREMGTSTSSPSCARPSPSARSSRPSPARSSRSERSSSATTRDLI